MKGHLVIGLVFGIIFFFMGLFTVDITTGLMLSCVTMFTGLVLFGVNKLFAYRDK